MAKPWAVSTSPHHAGTLGSSWFEVELSNGRFFQFTTREEAERFIRDNPPPPDSLTHGA